MDNQLLLGRSAASVFSRRLLKLLDQSGWIKYRLHFGRRLDRAKIVGGIEKRFKFLSIYLEISIQNMRINFRNHISLA